MKIDPVRAIAFGLSLWGAACGPKSAIDDDTGTTAGTAGGGTVEPTSTGGTNTPTGATSSGAADTTGDDPPPLKPDLVSAETGISGQYLLAVSTVIDPSKPLQFLATNQVKLDPEGNARLTVSLQPLSLGKGQVTAPRLPVGEPLVFEDIPIVADEFTLDAGTVMVPGMANPITGSDIVTSLVLGATIFTEDLYCGTVTGEVTSPLMVSIEGSTFAAVRVPGIAALPDPVLINCAGDAVTDP